MTQKGETTNLIAGALAALGASICCVVPLALVALGIGGSWIASLTAMEPYRPVFVGLTLLFLGLAFRRLYLAPRVCVPGSACADPRTVRRQRFTFWIAAIPLIGLLAVPTLGRLFY
ncbi:mercuric transporter MerT family protein [Burkholderia contaminans]|uniref:mercuric transporter MerT family protein n=1 Tax=Burkholderia contaminans TaxID=488447 RepID=UPI000F57435F|nr:mercuric transporter MerT family protein [Burkholderia contaminans]RQS87971.1 mercury transporter MerT [Burkholderia contaminans]